MAPPTINPLWRTDEDPTILQFEQLVYAAVSIGTVAYGIHAAVFAIATYHFVKAKKFPWFQQIYTTVLFLLAGITIACNLTHNQMTWIDNRAYPGGPGAFILEQQGQLVNTVGNAAGLVLAFMVDSLLIYRCFVVWNNNYYIVILPVLLIIPSTVMAILQTIAASEPASALWSARAVQYGLPYFVLNMTLNILVTTIIVARLLLARRRIRSVMGSDHGHQYTSIAAMLIESAAPPAIVSIILIALYAQHHNAQVLFFPLLPQVQAIAPQLIFIRVLRGRGWNKTTMSGSGRGGSGPPSNLSDVRFGSNPSATLNSRQTATGWAIDKNSSINVNINRSGSYEGKV